MSGGRRNGGRAGEMGESGRNGGERARAGEAMNAGGRRAGDTPAGAGREVHGVNPGNAIIGRITSEGQTQLSKSKERIIKSAKELFHKNGFQQTSVDEILRESGVTKSNFYYHFRGKEELGLTCLDRRIRQYEKDVLEKTLKDPSLTPAQRLTAFYEAVRLFHKKTKNPKGCPFGNLAIEMSGVNERFREKLSDFFGTWQHTIEECIAEGARSGEFRSDIPPETMAQLIISHLEGAIMMVKTHRSLEPLLSGSNTIMKLLDAA